MISGIRGELARWAEWMLRRNPLYLLSAVLMAVGARLYLVSPSAAPGDIGLIVTTLVVLQVYEWGVSGLLVLLHRSGRSPEDKSSLLLVAVMFWTGPMAATIELTAFRAELGAVVAAGACLIALGEMVSLQRILGIRMTIASQLIGAACVVLLAVAPPFLRVSDGGARLNELFLYATWWTLAVFALSGLGSIWSCSQTSDRVERTGRAALPLGKEMTFIAIVVGASAAHLVGMNHAFFCHASLFYVSPLIIAVSVVGVEYFVAKRLRHHHLLLVASALPIIALILAASPFDKDVPVGKMPVWFRDPLLTTAMLATAAWWFGYFRHRLGPMIHVGSASALLAAYRVIGIFRADDVTVDRAVEGAFVTREFITVALFAMAGYLLLSSLLRRSRWEALAALTVNLVAVVTLVWQRVEVDAFIICLVAGWSWVIGTRVLTLRPNLVLQLMPVTFLIVVTSAYDFEPALIWYARAHGLALTATLLLVGHVWPVTCRRLVGLVCAAAYVAFLGWRGVSSQGSPLAASVLVGGFLLLASGAFISWHKERFLSLVQIARDDKQS